MVYRTTIYIILKGNCNNLISKFVYSDVNSQLLFSVCVTDGGLTGCIGGEAGGGRAVTLYSD